ncbi:DNA-binding protein [Roseovarius nanhaiticus]|uniref:DNA-binding protein n=1 Tax=Roseovarius nanhaiticus TaxID=573024 RepID=UPI002491809A|nr:DNA-binding protein [Roseovarius nanhaiticus]
MVKQLLTKKIVAETISQLEKDGAEVTAKAIRDRVGVGSYSTAAKLLEEIRAEEDALLSMPEHVADEFAGFKNFIWTTAMFHATRVFEADRMLLERDRDRAEALARERLAVVTELEAAAVVEEKRTRQMEDRLREARKIIGDLERKLSGERTRAETLQAVVASMTGTTGADMAQKDTPA